MGGTNGNVQGRQEDAAAGKLGVLDLAWQQETLGSWESVPRARQQQQRDPWWRTRAVIGSAGNGGQEAEK